MLVLRREERRNERKRGAYALSVCGRVALKRFAAKIGELRNNVHFAAVLPAALHLLRQSRGIFAFPRFVRSPTGDGRGHIPSVE